MSDIDHLLTLFPFFPRFQSTFSYYNTFAEEIMLLTQEISIENNTRPDIIYYVCQCLLLLPC